MTKHSGFPSPPKRLTNFLSAAPTNVRVHIARYFPLSVWQCHVPPLPFFYSLSGFFPGAGFFTSLGDNLAPRKRIGVGAGKESFFSCTIHTIHNPAYGRPREWPNRPKKKSPFPIFPARQRRLRPRKKRKRKRGKKIPPGKQESSSGTWETNFCQGNNTV